jgi:hypothetical protein
MAPRDFRVSRSSPDLPQHIQFALDIVSRVCECSVAASSGDQPRSRAARGPGTEASTVSQGYHCCVRLHYSSPKCRSREDGDWTHNERVRIQTLIRSHRVIRRAPRRYQPGTARLTS